MKERKTKTLALVPLDLDGYLLRGWTNGKASQARNRLAADFRGWETNNATFENEIERVRIPLKRTGDSADVNSHRSEATLTNR